MTEHVNVLIRVTDTSRIASRHFFHVRLLGIFFGFFFTASKVGLQLQM